MFGAELVSYSNYRRSTYLTISPTKVLLGLLILFSFLTVSFVSGAFYGADYSADQYFKSYQSRIETQHETVEKLQILTGKELNTITAKLGELQGELNRLEMTQQTLLSDLDIQTPISNNWISQKNNTIENISIDVDEQIETIAKQIEKSQTELLAMHELYLRQVKSRQYLPTLRPADTYISSIFGWRKDPLGTGRTYYHEGIDFAGPIGTTVKAAASGIVTWSAPFDNYGNVVELDHGNGYITRYAHNNENLVSIGEKVEKGQSIATMGTSGRATGPHLHFEILKDGSHINPRRTLELN